MRQVHQKTAEPFLPQCPRKEMCPTQPAFSQYLIPEYVISVGKSLSKQTSKAIFCSHLHYVIGIISAGLGTTINSVLCKRCQSILEGLSSFPENLEEFWGRHLQVSASQGACFSNLLLHRARPLVVVLPSEPLQTPCPGGACISHGLLCPVRCRIVKWLGLEGTLAII